MDPYGFRDWSDSVALLAQFPLAQSNPEYLMSASLDGTVRGWDVRSGECIEVFKGNGRSGHRA